MAGPVTHLTHLTLTDFRSYERAEIGLDGGLVYLVGPNGAGKTNLLEAVSLLTAGRGLRGAGLAEIGRRDPGAVSGRAWAVAATLWHQDEPVSLGTGLEAPKAARRTVRLEGETVTPGRLAEFQRQVWLTPAQDRLFVEGAGDRRRFLDRLVYAAEPAHAVHVTTYDKTLRERMRLLTDGPADPAWLEALEVRMSEAGASLAQARARTLLALQTEIDSRGDRPFPAARLSFAGSWENLALEGATSDEISARLARALAEGRARDGAAGRGLVGPHRGDFLVVHVEKDRPAAECSTGEQKALVLNLILAQAARLSRAESAPYPILLLDEVAAHLDARRRAALFDEIIALKLQAFLTGTDAHLFEDLKGRAQGVHVDGSSLTPLEV